MVQMGWSLVLRVSRSGNLVHDVPWYDFATVLIPTKDAFNYINILEPGRRCEIREIAKKWTQLKPEMTQFEPEVKLQTQRVLMALINCIFIACLVHLNLKVKDFEWFKIAARGHESEHLGVQLLKICFVFKQVPNVLKT